MTSVRHRPAGHPVINIPRKEFSGSYLATPSVVGAARRACEGAALGWGVPRPTVEDVGVVVSELLTNAVRATPHQEVRVSVALNGSDLSVEVWDASPEAPEQRTPGLEDVAGRGLAIVEALSRECGVRPEPSGGKTVFAVLTC
ncbi:MULTISPECIES: ATP-binding protein [Actinomadura]|uniref:ATP-binding protein n=1 Tax=Actinomadura yumaensis TaxID=111807 RepID=A0ABW2CRG2_9ACTN|nr:ATP-binding protein [Actinomadura sp. J1-007]MWK35991.1 ATP-binding protein [Actinomadura sp. J1-007]